MSTEFFFALIIPFAGTSLGAACVFFLNKEIPENVRKVLMGFAAGIMVAASIWSLLIPAMDASAAEEIVCLPAVIGFWGGTLFLLLLDEVTPHLHFFEGQVEGPRVKLPRTVMLLLAVTLHNIPEGMAIGVVLTGVLEESTQITMNGALALSLGIAIQNFPEGAIISMPLYAAGQSRIRAFVCGILSGAVEPVGSILTILAAAFIVPALPYFLSFAAGAMLYVVVEELIPEMAVGEHSNVGVLSFSFGFTLMMVLDTVLG